MSTCDDHSNSTEPWTLNKCPVWERLYRLSTISTFLKSRQYQDLICISNICDSLDLALNSSYRHEKDFNGSRAQVLKQSLENRFKQRTITAHPKEKLKRLPNWLENRCNAVSLDVRKLKKVYDNSLNAETPHMEVSARGFSRKPDGSFYKVIPQRKEDF